MSALFCFSLLLLLGGSAAYQDWREKKIRNRLIAAGLAACAAVLAALFLSSALGRAHMKVGPFGEYYLPLRFYPKLAAHLALSFGAAFALWRMSVWPAGDAKLFTLLSLLAALADPNLPGFPAMLFLLLLINIFVPAGLVFAAESLGKAAARAPELARADWRLWPKAQLETAAIRLRELWPRRAEYAVLGVNLFALFAGVQLLLRRFLDGVGEPARTLAVFALMFVFWSRLVALLRRREAGLAAFAGLSSWLVGGSLLGRVDAGARVAEALRMTVNFGLFLSAGRLAFEWFIERQSLRELDPAQLRLGVVLSDRTWERLAGEPELAGRLSERRVDGLTQADADALKGWLTARGDGGYTVYQTIPFALWIFLGTLLTLSGRANVVALLAPHAARARAWLSAAAPGWFS